jgi:hypothetical protein
MEKPDMRKLYAGLVVAFVMSGSVPLAAQTIGYAEAIDRLSVACGKDIDRHCKKVNLGGGRVQQCLTQNQAKVSVGCRAAVADVAILLQKRAAARSNVLKVCDVDMRRLCPGVQVGDGNLLECFFKAERSASPACRQAVTDAGYR